MLLGPARRCSPERDNLSTGTLPTWRVQPLSEQVHPKGLKEVVCCQMDGYHLARASGTQWGGKLRTYQCGTAMPIATRMVGLLAHVRESFAFDCEE